MELVDVEDSKSSVRKDVWVQVPPGAQEVVTFMQELAGEVMETYAEMLSKAKRGYLAPGLYGGANSKVFVERGQVTVQEGLVQIVSVNFNPVVTVGKKTTILKEHSLLLEAYRLYNSDKMNVMLSMNGGYVQFGPNNFGVKITADNLKDFLTRNNAYFFNARDQKTLIPISIPVTHFSRLIGSKS